MYKVVTTKEFLKSLKKLDKSTQKLIQKYIENNIRNTTNPYSKGKSLKHNLNGYWRYRVGDYRLICEIIDEEITIILVETGHRKEVYKRK